MKINENFVLRQVAGTWILMPMGPAAQKLNGYLTLNESALVLWRALEEGADRETLIRRFVSEYDVSESQAAADVDELLAVLVKTGCLEESL